MLKGIEKSINDFLVTKGIEAPRVSFESTTELHFGDFSTNVAMQYAKMLSMNPVSLAKEIVAAVENVPHPGVDSIEVVNPGFINIRITADIIRKNIAPVLESVHTIYSGKKVLVEHSSPNLFKPFNIGFFVNNIIGEFVARSMKVAGAELVTLSFPSDVSLGIAKAIYIIKKDGGLGQGIFSKTTEDVVNYLGESYVRGTAYFKENPDEEAEVKEIASKLFAHTPSEEFDIYTKSAEINIKYFISTIEKFGSHFDALIYESEAGEVGKKIVLENTPGVFTESEGAVVYIPNESRKDINTAVFVNSQGNPTYEAKDVGLISLKFNRFNPDVSFFVTDHEQESHFRVVLDAVSKFNKEWADKSIHIPHGRMVFKGQKMSSRLGGVPLALSVVEAVLEEVKERTGEKINHLSEKEKEEVQWQVALSALRVAILRAKPGSNINFDPETSLSFEGDSGPYLLYSHARTSALLDKGVKMGFSPSFDETVPVIDLERVCLSFGNTLRVAIEEIAPQKLVTYLFRLAQEFNAYYASIPIVVEGDTMSVHRLAIVNSVKNILKKGIWVLGIEAPERM